MLVANIQRFCTHDGPGIRTTVFMKGCPLRCQWCHNPETQSTKPQMLFYEKKCIGCGACQISYRDCPTGARELCGTEYSTEDLLNELQKDIAFYGTQGGVTFSGGEPFLQANALKAVLSACKSRQISTAIDTCGYFDEKLLREMAPYIDLLLWDIKDTDDARHKQYTGVSNRKILQNLYLADTLGIPTRLRCILVNGVNTHITHYQKVAKIKSSLNHCRGVDFLPYHTYGESKAKASATPMVANRAWIPSSEQIQIAHTVVNRSEQCITPHP